MDAMCGNSLYNLLSECFYEQPEYGYYRKLNDIKAAFNLNITLTLKVSEQFLESWESAFSDILRLRLVIPMNYHQTDL